MAYKPLFIDVTGNRHAADPIAAVGWYSGVAAGVMTREQTTAYGQPKKGPVITLPVAEVGNPVPYIIGLQRLAQPNVIEYGNIQAIEETTYKTESTTERVTETKQNEFGQWETNSADVTKLITTATTSVVGYTCDLLLAICLGPGTRLKTILSDNVVLWSGDLGNGGTGTIPANGTFIGGTKFTFYSGEFDQTPYVGTSYIKFQNIQLSLPFASLQFDVSRYPNPLGLATSLNKIGDDLNIASAIAEIITNPWGGCGADISVIDAASFNAAATTLFNEGNKASLQILNTYDPKSIIDILQKQARGVVIQNPSTGKLEFNLVRTKAINAANTLQLNSGNIVELRNISKSGWANTPEQMRGTYTDRTVGYAPVPLFIQNVSNLSQSGRGKRTVSVDYPTVYDKDLAIKLMSRDMAAQSSPLMSFEIVTDRTAANAKPGDLALVNYPKFNIFSLLVTINKVRKQPITNNLVVLSVTEYPVKDGTVVYTAPDDPDEIPDPTKAIKPLSVNFYTAPYYIARSFDLTLTSQNVDLSLYAMMMVKPANDFQSGFASYLTNDPAADGDIQTSINSPYPTIAQLSGAIAKSDGVSTGTIANILIDSIVNPINLVNVGAQGVIDGQLLMFIDDEILSFESCVKISENQWQLNNVRRALIDTVPQAHSLGSNVFIIGKDYTMTAANKFSYPLSYLPSWKIVSRTTIDSGRKADALVSTGWTPSFNRAALPVRAHNTKINGVRYYDGTYEIYAGDTATVTWLTRDRTSLDIKRQTDLSETGETYKNLDTSKVNFQQHRAKLRDGNGTVFDLGVTDPENPETELDVTIPAGAAAGLAALWVQAETPAGVSYYNDEINITILPTPAIATEDGVSILVTEDGANYLITE